MDKRKGSCGLVLMQISAIHGFAGIPAMIVFLSSLIGEVSIYPSAPGTIPVSLRL